MKTSHFLPKIRCVDTMIVGISILAALGFWTRQIWIPLLLLPAGIAAVKHKTTSREEKDRRVALSLKSLAVSLAMPVVILFFVIVFLLFKFLTMIIANWQR